MAVYTDNGTNTPNGTHLEFTYTFPTIKTDGSDVKVALNNQTQATNKYTVTTTSPTKITFNNTSPDSTLQESSGAPKTGVTVRVYRDTYVDAAEAVYAAGSSIRAGDLNNNQDQVLYALQEEQQLKLVSEDISTGVINSDHIKDGAIVNADISDSAAIAQSKLSLDAELTELATMSSGTASALADLTQTEVQILDGATVTKDELNILDGVTATTAELNYTDGVTSNIQTQLDAKQATDAELTELATMASGTASALADLTQTEVQILDGVTATTTEINYVDGVTSNVQTQLDAKQASDAELTELATMASDTASALADLTNTEVAILDGATVTTTELNKLDGVTASATDLNITASMTKQTTISDSDTSYPTSGAVVDYVAGQLEPFGGFELAANRTSFPNTQPVAGVVISITDANGVVFDSTSTPDTTTGNCKTVGATNVTVQAAPDALQGKTIGAGVGMLVSSTGSGQNYTFHRLLAKDSDVETLSEDINDFNNRYRVAASEGALSGTDDEGDLYFDTGTNKMYVYDGSSWGEVTSTGDFKYLVPCVYGSGTGNAAVYGSATKFDLRENTTSGSLASVTNAAQLMVSVNGVIQKPNTGTSIGSNNGFCMEDGHTIVFGGTIAADSDVFVVQSGSALSINTPGDNTVTGAKIALGSDAAGDIMYYNGTDYVRLGKGTTGHYLKQGGSNAPEWAAVPAGVGGASGADFNDDVKLRFGHDDGGSGGDVDSIQGQLWWDETNNYFNLGLNTGSSEKIDISAQTVEVRGVARSSNMAIFRATGATDLMYNGTKKFETSNTGVTVAGTVAATAYTGDGSSLTGISSTVLDGCGYQNDQTISSGTYEIGANKGVHSVGPITVEGTITVTGTWVVS